MTTDARRFPARRFPARRMRAGHALAYAALACSALGCFGTTRTRHGDRVDVSSYPPEIRSSYRLFALRCSRCHTLARPLNAHIQDEQHWVRYVARMRRTPGSGINRHDAEVILRFLLYYTAIEKREHDERDDKAAHEADAKPAADARPAAPVTPVAKPSVAVPEPIPTGDGGVP